MSRSFKKSPISGNSFAESEKQGKRIANRTHRSAFRTALTSAGRLDGFQFDERSRAHSSIGDHAKDGKSFQTGLRVSREFRSLRVLAKPDRIASKRALYRELAK